MMAKIVNTRSPTQLADEAKLKWCIYSLIWILIWYAEGCLGALVEVTVVLSWGLDELACLAMMEAAASARLRFKNPATVL